MSSDARGPTVVLQPHDLRIPALDDLEDFRAWARSESFPEGGRIDWIGGDVEVDVAPEDLNTHGSPKAAIARALGRRIEEEDDRGAVYVDATRVSMPRWDLSVEPDIVCVLFESVETGRVALVPKSGGDPGRYVEIEGPPDLVVECVSDSSEAKDRERLRSLYERAGVEEYWIVDGRVDPPELAVLRRSDEGLVEAPADEEGFRSSGVLGCGVRLRRRAPRAGLVRHRLELGEP